MHRNEYASERLCIGYASERLCIGMNTHRNGYATAMHRKRHRNTKRGRNVGSERSGEGQQRIAMDKEGKGGEERRKIGEPMGRNRKAKEGKEGKVARKECSGTKRMSI
jgi:hypothetical protein